MLHSSARTGRLDATTSVAPSGSAAATSRATRASIASPCSSSTASIAARACASARCHSCSHGEIGAGKPSRSATAESSASASTANRSDAARVGSSHPPSASTSTCAIEGPSQEVAILLVSGAPTRTTRSGRWSSANAGARRSASYVEIANGGTRNCEIGSARTGQPAHSAKRAAEGGDTPAPHPATSNPRGCARTRSATRSTSAAAGARVAGVLTVHGRPSDRPGASTERAPVGTSGSRNGRFKCTGPAGGPSDSATATRERTPNDTRAGLVDRRSGIAEPPNRLTEQMHLVDRLTRAGVTKLRRTVCRTHDQRDARVRRLDHRRVEVRGCRSRGAQHHDRAAAPEREPERPERGRALVEHDLHA